MAINFFELSWVELYCIVLYENYDPAAADDENYDAAAADDASAAAKTRYIWCIIF